MKHVILTGKITAASSFIIGTILLAIYLYFDNTYNVEKIGFIFVLIAFWLNLILLVILFILAIAKPKFRIEIAKTCGIILLNIPITIAYFFFSFTNLRQQIIIMKLQLNKKYLIASLLLFIVETLIAIFLKDGFIRHTFGDYLVVILLYCMFKSVIKTKPFYIAIAVLIIAYGIEFLQLTNFLEVLHLQKNRLAKIILGSTFSVSDLIAYTLGVISILIFEYKTQNNE